MDRSIEDIDDLKRRLTRTKTIQKDNSIENSNDVEGGLKKCLTTWDLTSLGIGSCCGTGMYVVAGMVAKDVAGPGVIISFFIAAFASVLSGVCYAEFGVRVPKTTGSAYMYSYVTVGEFIAFVIGWNMILEYLIGTAAGASALSACFDALSNHTISDYMTEHLSSVIGRSYPDFIALAICLAMTAVVAVGVKKSVMLNNILNLVNLLVFLFIVVAGLFCIRSSNWSQYGFLPFGFSGVLSGAATCFYAFIGFDIIATTGEEAKEPSKSIPKAIVASLLTCLTAYTSVSLLLTLMIPYFDIKADSALVDLFAQEHIFDGAKYIVAIGSVCALTASLLGSMFPMPRVMFAMSRDGLLFEFFSKINESFQTPMIATVISGGLAAFTSMLVGLSTLVQMMSIGTLMAYTLVSISVLLQRYQYNTSHTYHVNHPEEQDCNGDTAPCESPGPVEQFTEDDDRFLIPPETEKKSYGSLSLSAVNSKLGPLRRNLFMLKARCGFPGEDMVPTESSSRIVTNVVCLLFIFMTALCLLLEFGGEYLLQGSLWAILLAVMLLLLICAGIFVLLRQPQNRQKLKFMAPCVPIIPCAAMFINIYLMIKLPPITWARFGVWLFFGFFIYFLYSIKFSKKGLKDNGTIKLEEEKSKEKELNCQNDENKVSIKDTASENNNVNEKTIINECNLPNLNFQDEY